VQPGYDQIADPSAEQAEASTVPVISAARNKDSHHCGTRPEFNEIRQMLPGSGSAKGSDAEKAEQASMMIRDAEMGSSKDHTPVGATHCGRSRAPSF